MPDFSAFAKNLFAWHRILPVAVSGKTPLGGSGWNLFDMETRLIMFQASMCSGCGIQCGVILHPVWGWVEVRVVDCDLNDPERQRVFAIVFMQALGEHGKKIVWRWGRRPACVVFTEPGKITRERYGDIQLLAPGKQAVWWGAHPAGMDYTHPDGDLLTKMPPHVPAGVLERAIFAACNAAGISLAPASAAPAAREITASELSALSPDDLARYRVELEAALREVEGMPTGTGRGTKLYNIGLRFGALAKNSPEFSAIVDDALAKLPGHQGAGDVRDFTRGVDASKGIVQQAQAARNEQHRQMVMDWRTGQPRQPVVDTLKIGVRTPTRASKLRELLQRPVEPMTQIIDGLVPSKGLFLIAADPKAGKSYVATDMALGVAEGSQFAGMACTQGAVMYIALEETHSEIMDRLHKLRPNGFAEDVQDRFSAKFFDEGVPRLEADFKGGLLEYMDDMLTEDPDLSMFLVDTLQHALGDIEAGQHGKNAYKIEYKAVSVLQAYALSRNVAIVLLHHTNKSNSENIGHRISGSQGISAAVSGYVTISTTEDDPYRMSVSGRVRGIGILKMEWTRDEGCAMWKPTIDMNPTKGASAKERVFNVLLAANCELTPADVAMRLKMDERVAAARLGDLKREGRVQNPHRGVYCLVNAQPRMQSVAQAIVRSGVLKPVTTDLRATHDPEGRWSHWAGVDASWFAFTADVLGAIESAQFHNPKDALKELDIHKLTHERKGIVWFFGAMWQQPTMQANPFALKMPWEV